MEYRRIIVKALMNGFLVDAEDYDYIDTQMAFTTYDEAMDWVKANPPLLKKPNAPTSVSEPPIN